MVKVRRPDGISKAVKDKMGKRFVCHEESIGSVVYVYTHYLRIDSEGYGHYKMYINNRLVQESISSHGIVDDMLKKHEWKEV